jgi:hypothetical protein
VREWSGGDEQRSGEEWGPGWDRRSVCVYLKRSRASAAVGAGMDGQDAEARVGQGSRCRMPIRHAADPSAVTAWAGFRGSNFEITWKSARWSREQRELGVLCGLCVCTGLI